MLEDKDNEDDDKEVVDEEEEVRHASANIGTSSNVFVCVLGPCQIDRATIVNGRVAIDGLKKSSRLLLPLPLLLPLKKEEEEEEEEEDADLLPSLDSAG